MKPLVFLGAVFTATLLVTGCDPHRPARKEEPAATKPDPKAKEKEKTPKPGDPTLSPEKPEDTKPENNAKVDTTPKPNVPPPPTPEKEEYAVKIPGKPGFVTDPGDGQNRPLDVRGMPPGTKIQSPFTGKLLLVPPQ